MELVRAICGQRIHPSTDGTPELRLIYHPNDIVGLDLNAEEDGIEDYGRDGLAPAIQDDGIEAYSSDVAPETMRSASPGKRSTPTYDPTQPEKLWVLKTIAKVGIPLKVEDYEASLRDPKKFLTASAAARRAAKKSDMKQGEIEKCIKMSKGDAAKISHAILESSEELLVSPSRLPLSPSQASIPQERLKSSRRAPVSRNSTSNQTSRTTRDRKSVV